jgi:hypothetical protein
MSKNRRKIKGRMDGKHHIFGERHEESYKADKRFLPT